MPYIPPKQRRGTATQGGFTSSLPDFLKAGYSQSIAGMVQTLAQGRVPLPTGDLSTAEKIGAGITSVVLDFPAFLLGGGVGGFGARIAAKQAVKEIGKGAFKKLVAKQTTKIISKQQATKIVTNRLARSFIEKDLKRRIGQRALTSGGAFGLHAAITSPLSQQISSGAVDPSEVGKDILKSATLGIAVGGVGGAVAKASGLTRLGAEIGTFTGVSAGLEGRLPTKEDLITSTGFILGLRGVGGIGRLGKRALAGQPLIQPRKPFEKVKLTKEQLEGFNLQKIQDKALIKKWTTPDQDHLVRTKPLSGLAEDFIPKPIREFLKPVFEGLKQGQDRVPSNAGRIIATETKKFTNLHDAYKGELMRKAEAIPIGKGKVLGDMIGDIRGIGKKKQAETISTEVEQGEQPGVKKYYQDIYKWAAKYDPSIEPPVGNYLTRIIRHDIIEHLFEGLQGMSSKTAEQVMRYKQGKKAPDKELVKTLKNLEASWKKSHTFEGKKISYPKTVLESLVKESQGDIVLAFQKMIGKSVGSVSKESTFLDKSRTAPKLPDEFYERDIRIILSKYINDVTRRVAHIQVFGPEGEVARGLLDATKLENKGDYGIVSRLYNAATGQDFINPIAKFSPTAKRFLDNVMAYNVAFKISTGFATIANLTQMIISTIEFLGVLPSFQGMYKFIKNAEVAREKGGKTTYQDFLKDSGAISYNLIDEFIGYAGRTGFAQKFARAMGTASGFKGINKLWQYTSAAGAEVAVNKYYKTSKGKGVFARYAQSKLEQMGVDYKKPLTEKVILGAMRRFAVNSQLQKNVYRDVMLLNDPKTRPLMLFKSFGLRQYQFQKDGLKFELSHGNFLPILRLGALGYFGGMFVDKARHWLKEFMAGEDIYKKEADGIEEFIEYIAQVGAFGVLGDIISAENKMQSLNFFVTPVILSDAAVVSKSMIRLFKDADAYGLVGALKRAPKGFAPIGGTAGRAAVRQIATRRQITDSMKAHRTFVLTKIKKDILKGNVSQAQKNIRSWNRANPQLPITYDDISYKKMYEFMLRKYEKRANP